MAYRDLNFPDDNGGGFVYRDEDFLDDNNLIEIPCEFCQDPFPMVLLMEHQTGCRPDLARFVEPTVQEIEAEFLNLENRQREREDCVSPELDASINIKEIPVLPQPPLRQKSVIPKETNTFKEQIKNSTKSQSEGYDAKIAPDRSTIFVAAIFKILIVLGTTFLRVMWFILKLVSKILMLFWNFQTGQTVDKIVTEEDDQKAIEKALQENISFANKKGNVEENKTCFKYPPNSLLDQDSHVPNDLTESDNEDNESLEDFWKRADIKLAQRLRTLGKKQCVDSY